MGIGARQIWVHAQCRFKRLERFAFPVEGQIDQGETGQRACICCTEVAAGLYADQRGPTWCGKRGWEQQQKATSTATGPMSGTDSFEAS